MKRFIIALAKADKGVNDLAAYLESTSNQSATADSTGTAVKTE